MKNIKFYCMLLICSILFACSKKYEATNEAVSLVDMVEMPNEKSLAISENEIVPQNVNNQSVANKKIIKKGNIDIKVEDVQKARQSVENLLKSANAYIQEDKYNNSDWNEGYALSIRIPNQHFDNFVNSLNSNVLGKITEKNISVQDVTEEYTDVSIRLKNKQLYLEKYREFLRSAKTTSDMLEVQEKIRNMEEEIESAEGKLRYIDDRVNYSTLHLSLYKEKPPRELKSDTNFFARLWNSVVNGWDIFVEFIIGIVTVWPLWIIIFVIIWLLRKYIKKRKAKKLPKS